MRVKHFVTVLLVLFLGLALTGCAGMSTKSTADITCTPKNINAMLKSGEYQKKVDNFLIIQDASSSMADKLGRSFSNSPTKLTLSKELVRALNKNLPDNFDVNAGMRAFGPYYSEKGLIYGMTDYTKAGLDDAVLSIAGTGGITPMANSIIHGAYDLLDTPGLTDTPGRTAVILFSDGLNNVSADPVAAAAAMKDMYGNSVCIYTVLLGNDPKGKATMEQIAAAGKCGFATEADNLHSRTLADGSTVGNAGGMGDFVTDVFLEKAPKRMVDGDSDGDGVKDSIDQCPNTPRGIKVDRVGCPVAIPEKLSITLLIEFDFDKAVVRPQYHNDIQKVANFLKAYPKTNGVLEGHTDSIGSEDYNKGLSKRRAESVKNYLVNKFNINSSRISTVGHGESKPVASNKTSEGRQRNRRVVANIVTITVK